ncbi:MAG: hypothetical protein AAB890_00590 [Patescibacteria group bacterium]
MNNNKGFINIVIIGVVVIIIAAAGYFSLTRNTETNWKYYEESYNDISFKFQLPHDFTMTNRDSSQHPYYFKDYKGSYKNNPYTFQVTILPTTVLSTHKQYSSLEEFIKEQDKTGIGKILASKNIDIDGRFAIQREEFYYPHAAYDSVYLIMTYLLEKNKLMLIGLWINRISQDMINEPLEMEEIEAEISEQDRQFFNQILSTFKFIE